MHLHLNTTNPTRQISNLSVLLALIQGAVYSSCDRNLKPIEKLDSVEKLRPLPLSPKAKSMMYLNSHHLHHKQYLPMVLSVQCPSNFSGKDRKLMKILSRFRFCRIKISIGCHVKTPNVLEVENSRVFLFLKFICHLSEH